MNPNWFVGYKVKLPGWLPLNRLPGPIRWFDPADYHVTIAFLGQLNQEQINKAIQLFEMFQPRAFRLAAEEMIALPATKRFSALCLRLADDPGWIEQVQDAHKHFLSGLHLPDEKRPPLAHITLARPLRKANASQRRDILDAWLGLACPTLMVELDQIALYTWNADRSQRQFQEVRLLPCG